MKSLLEGFIISEQLNGRITHVHDDWGAIYYPEFRSLHPKNLILSDRKYIEFFVKNAYLNDLKAILNHLKIRYDNSISTTSVYVCGEFDELLKFVDRFESYIQQLENDYTGQNAI